MGEIVICKCGKSKVIFESVGEDLWNSELDNCHRDINKDKGEIKYICNDCGQVVDYADYYMMCEKYSQ